MYDTKGLKELIGRQVEKVYLNSEYLKFVLTDGHEYSFTVEGDCCSHSYFYDFIGLDKLLKNKITSVGEVSLSDDDPRGKVPDDDYEYIAVYGYEIVTEDPEFGEVTTVFSFRNSSNGYYGGWMHDIDSIPDDVPALTKDTTEVKD